MKDTAKIFILFLLSLLQVQGGQHPSLYMRKCSTNPAVWISEEEPQLPSKEYDFQWQNKWRAIPCEMEKKDGKNLSLHLQKPMRCIAPGQYAAFYHGNICLGGAMIRDSKSLFDEGQTEPYEDWRISDFEVHYNSTT